MYIERSIRVYYKILHVYLHQLLSSESLYTICMYDYMNTWNY